MKPNYKSALTSNKRINNYKYTISEMKGLLPSLKKSIYPSDRKLLTTFEKTLAAASKL
jgi:hypothetical protein